MTRDTIEDHDWEILNDYFKIKKLREKFMILIKVSLDFIIRNKRKPPFFSLETALAIWNEDKRLSTKSFVSLSLTSIYPMNWIAFYKVERH